VHVQVVDHPLAAERLSVLRNEATDRATFRHALDGLAGMLIYEALSATPVERVRVRTPLGVDADGVRLTAPPLVVPVLRAGLGMLEAARRLLPGAEVGFVGLHRDEATFAPVQYLAAVPDSLTGRQALVLDPMLATGGSLARTCEILAERGAVSIQLVCVLAAPEGIAHLRAAGVVSKVVTAAVDERLNDKAFIVPGLGDAGDRQFGPD